MWWPTCIMSLQGLWLHLFAPTLPWGGGGLCPPLPWDGCIHRPLRLCVHCQRCGVGVSQQEGRG